MTDNPYIEIFEDSSLSSNEKLAAFCSARGWDTEVAAPIAKQTIDPETGEMTMLTDEEQARVDKYYSDFKEYYLPTGVYNPDELSGDD